MKKVALTFPSYDSLWLFKSYTNAIHIRIEPKKQRIYGLFDADEIEMAVTKFKALKHNEENVAGLTANAGMAV
jgi:hypothetical protein